MQSTDSPAPALLDDVLDGVAENPALPTALALRLTARPRTAGRVAKRPGLPDAVIAAILDRGERRPVSVLARNRDLPAAVRLRLAAHRDASVRVEVAVAAPEGARDVFEMLIDDPDVEVRDMLARRRAVPADLRARLATDPDPRVRHTLATMWTRAPEEVRRVLLTDPDAAVRTAACPESDDRFAAPPADMMAALLADSATRAGAAAHAELDADTISELHGSRSWRVRAGLARNPGLPAEVRDALAEDPAYEVKLAVFARPDTPGPVRAAIYDAIHAPLGSLEDLDPAEARQRRVTHHYGPGEFRRLDLRWVTDDPLPYVDSPYVCFRAAAAASRTLPPEAVARLLEDEEELVRVLMVCSSPHLVDPATAERLERRYRGEPLTKWLAERNVLPLSAETARRFATDPEPRLRSLAPRDPSLPTDLAASLAGDPEPRVREAVAAHPNLPRRCLFALLTDPVAAVATAAGRSALLPVEQMERLLALAGL